MASVRTRIPEASLSAGTLSIDLEVEFAGQTAHYNRLPFQQVIEATQHRISGTIPAKVTDFKIDPPSLLTVPIKNDIPVKVEMVKWFGGLHENGSESKAMSLTQTADEALRQK